MSDDDFVQALQHQVDWLNGQLTEQIALVQSQGQTIETQRRGLVTQAEKLEQERMRLAACMIAALKNTPERYADRLASDHPYMSASYRAVCDAVDREVDLRTQLAEQAHTLTTLREIVADIVRRIDDPDSDRDMTEEAFAQWLADCRAALAAAAPRVAGEP